MININRWMKTVWAFVLTATAVLLNTGCAMNGQAIRDSATEVVGSYFEKPNMEKQLNRTATGLGILKTNNVILYEMPISADAQWPKQLAEGAQDDTKSAIMERLADDPYYGTVHYTDMNQGSYGTLFKRLSSIEMDLYHRLFVIFENQPTLYKFSMSLEDYKTFEDGNFRTVEAAQTDMYDNIEAAIIDMMPVNMQKDVKEAADAYKAASADVAALEGHIEELELKIDEAEDDTSLIEEELETTEVELEAAEKDKETKLKAFETLWESAVANMDLEITDEKIKLAKTIENVLSTVNGGATQAAALFSVALAKMPSSLDQMPQELANFADAMTKMPASKAALMEKRVSRLKDNALMAIPSIGIGTVLITDQLILTSQYEDAIEQLLDLAKQMEEQKKMTKTADKSEK